LCVVGWPQVLAQALGSKDRGRPPPSTRLTALHALPLVLPLPPNAVRSLLDEQAQRHGVRLQVMLAAGSSVIIKHLLQEHACASLLPRHAVVDEVARGALAAAPLPYLPRAVLAGAALLDAGLSSAGAAPRPSLMPMSTPLTIAA
jgi:LysR family transcriptional regulator, nitrogen assimilation regulatory protein